MLYHNHIFLFQFFILCDLRLAVIPEPNISKAPVNQIELSRYKKSPSLGHCDFATVLVYTKTMGTIGS